MLALLLACACAAPAVAQDTEHGDPGHDDAEDMGRMPVPRLAAPAWDKESLELFATLPVQDGGRVKPLDTMAQFTLLALNGSRTLRLPSGEKRSHIEWLLDCLFYPEIARNYPCFLVNTGEAVAALGVPTHDKKRDRYAYSELQPGRAHMLELARHYESIEARNRSSVEQQILDLAHNVFRFEELIQFLDFARARFTAAEGSALAAAITDPQGAVTSELVALLDRVSDEVLAQGDTMGAEQVERERQVMSEVYFQQLMPVMTCAQAIACIPSPDRDERQWYSPGELPHLALDQGQPRPELLGLLGHFEKMAANREARLAAGDDAEANAALDAAFVEELRGFRGAVIPEAEARGEYDRVPLEVFFYRAKFVFYSQWLYVLSFVLVAISWLLPRRRIVDWAVSLSVWAPTLLLVAGITLRCIIRNRPPVTTLYETILFVTAVAVTVAMCIEWINRRRIAVAVASFLGMLGMFLAYRYEIKEGVDTMPSLIAVLDTNFWLATHVTTVTMGYSAGLLAGAIAHLYIFCRLFGIRRDDIDFNRGLTRMVYGVLCFGILFATVGTVLGGIWANDSWGRFWGWDPKENGALLIVLWGLIILHARLGRYIRDLGIHMSAVAMGMVVAFSWWGVNLLGVGLHSYGFTSGIGLILKIFWIAESVVLLVGGFVWLLEHSGSRAALATLDPEDDARTA